MPRKWQETETGLYPFRPQFGKNCTFAKKYFGYGIGYTEDWLDFIVLNRTNETEQQLHDYDIVEGNVANDEVTTRVFDWQNGLVSRETLLEELKYKAPNHQFMQSLQALIPVKNDMNIGIIHIDNQIVKSLMSDRHKNEMEATAMYYKSKTYSTQPPDSIKKTGL